MVLNLFLLETFLTGRVVRLTIFEIHVRFFIILNHSQLFYLMLEIKYVAVLSWKISGEFHPDTGRCRMSIFYRIVLSGSGTSLLINHECIEGPVTQTVQFFLQHFHF